MSDADKLKVLDMVFVGCTLRHARNLCGLADGATGYGWLFRDAEIRAAANERIRAGKRLPEVAMKALARFGEQLDAPPVSNAELLAKLDEVRAENTALRSDICELSRRIELLYPEEALVQKAVDYADRVERGYGMVTAAVREAKKRYNPVTVAKLRNAFIGWPKLFASFPHA